MRMTIEAEIREIYEADVIQKSVGSEGKSIIQGEPVGTNRWNVGHANSNSVKLKLQKKRRLQKLGKTR